LTSTALRRIRRRYHLLLGLRFVPTGLMVTVFVLLLQDRGLTLAEIGLGTAAQGVVMLFLELPSGGLADALGRKPVVLLAGAFGTTSLALLLVTHSVGGLAVACTLQGIFRALDSGTLQAWYIDSLIAVDPEVDIEGALGRSEVVTCSAIGAGALLSGLIVARGGLAGVDPLVAPIAAAAVVQVLGVGALALLVDETRRPGGWRAARASVIEVPNVVRDAMALVRASTILSALVVAEGLWGFGMIAFETLMPPRLAEVSGGASHAAATLGPAITAAWVVSALGSGLAPSLARRFGAGPTGFALRLVHGLAVVAMAMAAGPVGLVAAYLATYWVHGATNTVHYSMVHRAVDSRHRATVVSANSLTSQMGGAVSGIALGALADSTSITTAMAVAALALAAAAPLYLAGRWRPARATPPPPGRRAAAGGPQTSRMARASKK
jgi:predicted MFS family arabinose efflux permease